MQTCIMEVDGVCRSDYNYGNKCDGKNIPKDCPYESKARCLICNHELGKTNKSGICGRCHEKVSHSPFELVKLIKKMKLKKEGENQTW